MLLIMRHRHGSEVSLIVKSNHSANHHQANVDEVFIDLCRQIIRKDNTTTPSLEEEVIYHRRDRDRGRRPLQSERPSDLRREGRELDEALRAFEDSWRLRRGGQARSPAIDELQTLMGVSSRCDGLAWRESFERASAAWRPLSRPIG